MKYLVTYFTLILFCALDSDVVGQRRKTQSAPQGKAKQTVSSPVAIPPEQAAEMLNKLKVEEKLVPEGFELGYSQEINVGNCFGWKFPNGLRLLGESRGHQYGLYLNDKQMIGFLFSEVDLLIGGKPVDKGPYILFADVDAVELAGDSKTTTITSSETGKKIPWIDKVILPLSSKIDATLVDKKSEKRARFSLVQEGKDIFLNLEGNRFPVKLK